MDKDNKNLFPEINPNIDEIIEKENCVDKEEVLKEDLDFSKPKTSHSEIFMKKKQNIKLKVKEPTDTITESDVKKSKPAKDRYAHLAKARQKGIETRRRKAEEKRKAKAEEKAKKAEEREARKRATAERNRESARQRYYKQKAEKQNVAQKIVDDISSKEEVEKIKYIRKNKQLPKEPVKPNGMDFNTFAKYMMKYEQMKDAYNKQKTKTKPKPIPVKKEEKPKENQYHPPNYPLSMYAPTNRYKEFSGF